MSIKLASLTLIPAIALSGCGPKALALPDDPIERAATCSVVAAADARVATGVKGNLSAEAQGRIFHYPLLAASAGGSYDADIAAAVFKREHPIADAVTKGKWQDLKPACASAYPATTVTAPELPAKPLDSAIECYMTVDFMRKALAGAGQSYAEAVTRYGALVNKLDPKVSTELTRAGIKGNDAIQTRRKQGLADSAKLGPPPAVIEACTRKYS